MEYRGHTGVVTTLSTDTSGEWLATGNWFVIMVECFIFLQLVVVCLFSRFLLDFNTVRLNSIEGQTHRIVMATDEKLFMMAGIGQLSVS